MSRNGENDFEKRLANAWLEGCRGQSETALDLAKQVRHEAGVLGLPDICARADHHIAWFSAQIGRAYESIEPIISARATWRALGNDVELARTSATYAWLLMELGDSENAISEATDALMLAERAGSDEVLALACNTQSLSLNYAGQLDSALPLLDRAIAIGRTVDDHHALARWLLNRGFLEASVGDRAKENGDEALHRACYERALAFNDESVALAEKHQSSWILRVGLANSAEYSGVLGRLDRAEAYLKRWEKVEGAIGDRVYIQYYYTQSELLTRAGRLDEARAICELAVERAKASGITLHELNSVRRLSDVYEASEDFKAALGLYKRYHLLYKKFSGEMTQTRARITQVLMETEKLKSLADQANERADKAAADALSDALTGIANRRALDQELARLDTEAVRDYSVAIVDLDHFKAVNDVYSHMVGDDVLRVVADTLAGIVRPGDMVSRMGGEEFAVILAGAGVDAAESICERFRTRLEAVDWDVIAPGLAVTASIGLAASIEAGSARDVLALADTRLYAAKSAGRNRVVGHRGAGNILVH